MLWLFINCTAVQYSMRGLTICREHRIQGGLKTKSVDPKPTAESTDFNLTAARAVQTTSERGCLFKCASFDVLEAYTSTTPTLNIQNYEQNKNPNCGDHVEFPPPSQLPKVTQQERNHPEQWWGQELRRRVARFVVFVYNLQQGKP